MIDDLHIEQIADSIIEKADQMQKKLDHPIKIAIDGRCGSGKSTLAYRIQEKTGWNLVHMDDFFLQPYQRTQKRLQTPGANVDYERFLQEVLEPYEAGKSFQMRKLVCPDLIFAPGEFINPTKPLLVEGSYSFNPNLIQHYDLKIFLDIDPQTQIERIRGRVNEKRARLFEIKWIPLEELYFNSLKIKEQADLTF